MPDKDTSESEEYVDRKLKTAEECLEEAIIASDDPDQRAELLSNYRGILVTLQSHRDGELESESESDLAHSESAAE